MQKVGPKKNYYCSLKWINTRGTAHSRTFIIIFYFENVAFYQAKLGLDVCPRVDNQTSGETLQDLTRPLAEKSPSAIYPPKGFGTSFWWWDAIPHQPVGIREKTLESGNLFSGSWISASVPLWFIFHVTSCVFSSLKLICVSQVASRVLNIPTSKIYISETSSSHIPNTSPTAASFSSDLNGMAVLVKFIFISIDINSLLYNIIFIYLLIYLFIIHQTPSTIQHDNITVQITISVGTTYRLKNY